MNDLLKIRIRDNIGGRTYQLIGFTSAGDDRSGLNVVNIVIYDPDTRTRTTVGNPLDLKRFSVVIE